MLKLENKPKKPKKSVPNSRGFMAYTGIAAQMAIIMTIGVYGGLKLDEWLGLEFPIFILIGSLAGAALSMYTVIKEFI